MDVDRCTFCLHVHSPGWNCRVLQILCKTRRMHCWQHVWALGLNRLGLLVAWSRDFLPLPMECCTWLNCIMPSILSEGVWMDKGLLTIFWYSLGDDTMNLYSNNLKWSTPMPTVNDTDLHRFSSWVCGTLHIGWHLLLRLGYEWRRASGVGRRTWSNCLPLASIWRGGASSPLIS
jgi:hypothetical protein